MAVERNIPATQRRSGKSASAFRTISEVAEELDVPAHVLRFWETKFPNIKPMKRGGGRRYYRPEDVDLLRRIRALLYAEGYTIKGVQRLMREGDGRGAINEADTSGTADACGDAVSLDTVKRRELINIMEELKALRALLDSADK